MWIIQFKKTMWIDAKKIDCIWINGKRLKFTVVGDSSNSFTVDSELEGGFLNHLGAMNKNCCCDIQSQAEAAKNDG